MLSMVIFTVLLSMSRGGLVVVVGIVRGSSVLGAMSFSVMGIGHHGLGFGNRIGRT
jgi:hypothetical protein